MLKFELKHIVIVTTCSLRLVLGTPDISMDQQGQEQGNGQENQSFLTVTPLKGQEQENGQENQSFPTVTPLKGKEQKNENDNQFISVETNKGKEQNSNKLITYFSLAFS